MTEPEIQIREATVEDAPEIARLLHDFNTEYEQRTPPVAELTRHAERMLREGEMTVLLAGEGPDGLAVLRFRPSVWTEQQEAYLQELYVVPDLRGQCIGEALMQAMLATCRDAMTPPGSNSTPANRHRRSRPLQQTRLHQRRRTRGHRDALLRAASF